MTHLSTSDLAERLAEEQRDYMELLSEDSMRVELARYPNPEPKAPHREDELYVIISGSGRVHVGSETHDVSEGDVVYVEQGLEHDFVDIDEEITALVIFTGSQESVLDQEP